MKFEVTPVVWQLGALLLLALIMAFAVVTDFRQRRIPNSLVLFALCSGLLIHIFGPINGDGGLFSYWPGTLGVKKALLGALTGLAVLLPLYALRAMGAGDVKLMAAIGSFAGPADALNLVVFVLLMGGVLALCRMLWKRNFRQVFTNLQLMAIPLLHGGQRAFDPQSQSADRMPYAMAMAAGLAAYLGWLWLGGLPLVRF